MAEKTFVIRIEPSRDLEAMLQRVAQAAALDTVRPEPEMEPVTVQVPDGKRVLFVDAAGDPHWPLEKNLPWAQAKEGWRQAYVRRAG